MARADKVLTIHSSKCRKVARLNINKIDEALRKATALHVESFAINKYATPTFTPGTTAVPPSGKLLGAQELKNMVDASLDGWLTTGRFNAEFEKKLAAFIGIKHLITVNSGSSANLVAFNKAACGLAQLEKAPEFIQARKDNFAFLKARLQDCAEFINLPQATEHSDPSRFGFPITLKENCPVTRLDLLTYLDQNKVGSRLLFAGNLTRQPYMAGANYRISGDLTNTDNVMNNTFWIGVQPALTREMLEFAAAKIESYLGVNF